MYFSGNPLDILARLAGALVTAGSGLGGMRLGSEGGGGEDPLYHPTWFKPLTTFDYKVGEETLTHHGWLPAWIPEIAVVTWFVILVLAVLAIIGTRNLRVRNPGKFQLALEFIVTSLEGFVRNIVGDREAKTLTPIIGTAFIFILSLNLIGLVPGFIAPTSQPATTIALALMAFFFVQYMAISRQGFVNYLKHFMGEPIWMAPLMLPIHIIGELARPLSLSIRLFGNIFGEETVIAVLIMITGLILGPVSLGWIPLQFPMMLFVIFGSFVQALVFSMLVSIYIAVAVAGHEEQH